MGHLKLFSSLGRVNESRILSILLQPPCHTILHLRQLSSWNLESFPTFQGIPYIPYIIPC